MDVDFLLKALEYANSIDCVEYSLASNIDNFIKTAQLDTPNINFNLPDFPTQSNQIAQQSVPNQSLNTPKPPSQITQQISNTPNASPFLGYVTHDTPRGLKMGINYISARDWLNWNSFKSNLNNLKGLNLATATQEQLNALEEASNLLANSSRVPLGGLSKNLGTSREWFLKTAENILGKNSAEYNILVQDTLHKINNPHTIISNLRQTAKAKLSGMPKIEKLHPSVQGYDFGQIDNQNIFSDINELKGKSPQEIKQLIINQGEMAKKSLISSARQVRMPLNTIQSELDTIDTQTQSAIDNYFAHVEGNIGVASVATEKVATELSPTESFLSKAINKLGDAIPALRGLLGPIFKVLGPLAVGFQMSDFVKDCADYGESPWDPSSWDLRTVLNFATMLTTACTLIPFPPLEAAAGAISIATWGMSLLVSHNKPKVTEITQSALEAEGDKPDFVQTVWSTMSNKDKNLVKQIFTENISDTNKMNDVLNESKEKNMFDNNLSSLAAVYHQLKFKDIPDLAQ